MSEIRNCQILVIRPTYCDSIHLNIFSGSFQVFSFYWYPGKSKQGVISMLVTDVGDQMCW